MKLTVAALLFLATATMALGQMTDVRMPMTPEEHARNHQGFHDFSQFQRHQAAPHVANHHERRLASVDKTFTDSKGAEVYAYWESPGCENTDFMSSLSLYASSYNSSYESNGVKSPPSSPEEYGDLSMDIWSDCTEDTATHTYMYFSGYGGDMMFDVNSDLSFASLTTTSANSTFTKESCTKVCHFHNFTDDDAAMGDDGIVSSSNGTIISGPMEHCYFGGNCTILSVSSGAAELTATWTATTGPANSTSISVYSDSAYKTRSSSYGKSRSASVSLNVLVNKKAISIPSQANLTGSISTSSSKDIYTTY
ncbi:hypothetical protein MPSEU_000948600 [Mayamaea pseudoterrestris]|nr:hypothetical protein MPSEU_000948600 [Mayamaea pseudoterrestris]